MELQSRVSAQLCEESLGKRFPARANIRRQRGEDRKKREAMGNKEDEMEKEGDDDDENEDGDENRDGGQRERFVSRDGRS